MMSIVMSSLLPYPGGPVLFSDAGRFLGLLTGSSRVCRAVVISRSNPLHAQRGFAPC